MTHLAAGRCALSTRFNNRTGSRGPFDTNGILVSDVVKQMVTGKDFDFEDRGPVELKGFDEPVRAWAVRWQ